MINTDYDFISPISIICIMTLLSLAVMVFFYSKIGYTVSLTTVLMVSIAMISFSIAGILMPVKVNSIKPLKKNDIVFYRRSVIIFSFVFVLITLIAYYYEVRKVAMLSGYSSSSMNPMLFYYRRATLTGSDALESQSKLVGQATIVSYCISSLIAIDFAKRLVFKVVGSKIDFFLEILVIILRLIQTVLNGGRTQFLYYIETLLLFIIYFYIRKNRRTINRSILKKFVYITVGVFILFYLLGNLTGKTSTLNFSQTLFAYVGSPIPAFDQLIAGKIHFENKYFGSAVFYGPYQLLNYLGFNFDIGDMAGPSVAVGNTRTNIYGSFARYYDSFGVFGMVLINFFIGIFYQIAYRRLFRDNANIELNLFTFALVSCFIFDFCTEERFFMNVISIGTILRFIYAFLIIKLFNLRVKVRN